MAHQKMYLSVWRDISTHKSQFLGIVLMIALGAGSLGMFLPSYYNLGATYDETYTNLGLADFSTSTLIQTDSLGVRDINAIMAQLSQEYPIASYESRIVYDLTAVENNSGELSMTAIRLIGVNVTGGRHPTVDDVDVLHGRWFVDADNWNNSASYNDYVVLIDTRLSLYHNMTPNARINLLVQGNVNETTSVRVIGDVGTAEYLWLASSWQDIMPSAKRFGVMYMPLSSAQHMLGFDANGVNDICVRMKADTPIAVRDQAMHALETALLGKNYSIMPPVPKEQQPSYAGLEFDLEGISEIVLVFPMFILLLAIFGTYVTMSRLVAAQRQEVGVFMAMGYSRKDVYKRYVTYSLIVAMIGALLGIVIGEVSARWFTNLYLSMLVVPFRYFGVYPDVMAANVIIAIAVCLLGTSLPARKSANTIPAVAMRDDPTNMIMGKVTLAERIYDRLTDSQPRARNKIIIRNLFRNRKRTVSTLVGIIMSFVLVAATAATFDSFNATISAMSVQEGWDIQLQYTDFKLSDKVAKDIAQIEAWPDVESAFSGIAFSTVLTSNYSNVEAPLQIRIQNPSDAVHKFMFASDKQSFNNSGIVITQGTANKLNVEAGMNISILHPKFNITSLFPLQYTFKMQNSSLRVIGISHESTSLVCWISTALAEHLIGQAGLDANTIYIQLKDISPSAVDGVKQKIFRQITGVRAAISVSDAARDMNDYLQVMQLFLFSLIGFAVALAGSIVLTTAVINVMERKTEVATVLTMGAPPSFSQKTFQIENIIITLVGLVIGLPFSLFALEELGASFTTDFMVFVVVMTPLTVILSAIVILLTTVVVQWWFVRNLSKMDLAQETKRRIQG